MSSLDPINDVALMIVVGVGQPYIGAKVGVFQTIMKMIPPLP